jgi:hypothetical protein
MRTKNQGGLPNRVAGQGVLRSGRGQLRENGST